MHERGKRFPPERRHMLKDEERRNFLPAERILQIAQIHTGETIVEVGAGTGFWTEVLSRLAGQDGRVFAVDVEPIMVEELRTLVQERSLDNIRIVRSEEVSIPLDDGIADLVFLGFVLHELDEPVTFLREVVRLLKPEGRVLTVDWQDRPTEHGPPLDHRISAEEARALLGDAGLAVDVVDTPTPEVYALLAREFHPGDPEAIYPTA